MRKLLSFVLIAAMLLALLVGCSSNEPATEPEATTPVGPTEEAPATEEKELIEMSIGVDNTDITSLDIDAWGQALEEKFNVKVTLVPFDRDKLTMMAVSGTLPDFFNLQLSTREAFFVDLIEEGQIRGIPDEMIAKYPNTKALQDAGQLQQAVRETYGENYGLCKGFNGPEPEKMASTAGFYYRADWLENVGLDVPETTEEFYEMLRAFTFDDPDQNGIDDTYGTSGWLWQIHFMPWTDLYGWVKEDGQWIPGYLSDGLLEGLKFWNQAYQEGIIDPEYSMANAKNLFVQGTIGVYPGNRDVQWLDNMIDKEFPAANPDIENVTDVVKVLPPLKKDESSEPRWPQMLTQVSFVVNSNVDDAKLDRFLEIHNWFQTEEAVRFWTYGIEGVDYTVDESGNIVSNHISPETGKPMPLDTVYDTVKIRQAFDVGWRGHLDPLYSPYSEEMIALAKEVAEVYDPATVVMNYNIMMASVPSKFDATYTSGAAEGDIQAIVAGNDVEGDFAALKEKALEAGGMRQVIDDINAYAQEHGIE